MPSGRGANGKQAAEPRRGPEASRSRAGDEKSAEKGATGRPKAERWNVAQTSCTRASREDLRKVECGTDEAARGKLR